MFAQILSRQTCICSSDTLNTRLRLLLEKRKCFAQKARCYDYAKLLRLNPFYPSSYLLRTATNIRPIFLLRLSLLICLTQTSRKFPMGLGIPPRKTKIVLESNPLKSRILARRLAARPVFKSSRWKPDLYVCVYIYIYIYYVFVLYIYIYIYIYCYYYYGPGPWELRTFRGPFEVKVSSGSMKPSLGDILNYLLNYFLII